MNLLSRLSRTRLTVATVLIALTLAMLLAVPAAAKGYKQTNLVSDIPGLARFTNANLVNPWGITFAPNGTLWVADNGTGVATLFHPNGRSFPLIVTIPPPEGSTDTSAPTGIVFNPTNDFQVSAGGKSSPARFLFATEDGTIAGWDPSVNPTVAILAVDNSEEEAIYKGIALGAVGSNNYVYVTNFHSGFVEQYDADFHFVREFTDPAFTPTAEPGFAPFGIRNIGGLLFVTYALQDADKEDDVAGVGLGYVDIFDTSGNFIRRFASQGTLNAPWGLVVAPSKFGQFSNALLVGNFGDGKINAFNLQTGAFLGQLTDHKGNIIVIDGLWGLTFGIGPGASEKRTLYFAAGINDEANGLLGTLIPTPVVARPKPK